MFILECLHKDADLFFKLLKQQDGSWAQHCSRQDYENHSKITCLLELKRKGYDLQVKSFKDYLIFFLVNAGVETFKFIPAEALQLNACLALLDDNLKKTIKYHEIKYICINWEKQKQLSNLKLLLNITG